MRLRHIEVFHAIMQAGTISGAAEVLHISQPAVTKVLQHCELQLGMQLFERVRGKLYPRPEAHRLFVETGKLNRDLQSIRRLAASLKGEHVESVRVVSSPAIAVTILPDAMTHWRRDFPQTRCELSTHHTSEVVNTLLLGEADMAFLLHDPRHPAIVAEPIAEGVMTVIAPARSWAPQLANTPLSINELDGEMIGLPDNDPLGSLVAAAFDAHGMQPLMRTIVQTYQLASALVEAGSSMAVVDPFTAAQAGKLQKRPFSPAIPIRLYLLTAANAPLSHGARELAACIAASARACLDGSARKD